MIPEIKKSEKSRRQRLLFWNQRMKHNVSKHVNESQVHIFGFKFNEQTLKIEKFIYDFSLNLENCFPYQKEVLLNYLRKQYFYLKNINLKTLDHLTKKLEITKLHGKTHVYYDEHKEHENRWKLELRKNMNQTKFFSNDEEFFCLFQHKFYLQEDKIKEFNRSLLGKLNISLT